MLGSVSDTSVWTLALLAIVAVFLPQTVHASENIHKTEAFEFSGVYNPSDETTTTMAVAPMITTTQISKPVQTKTTKTVQPRPSTIKNPPPTVAPLKTGEMFVSVSSYTSSPEETSGNPFITASGARVHLGTAAWNGVPFGTKFMLPEISGDLVYTVEDRGSMRVMGTTTIDVWRETKAEAFAIGRRHGVRLVFVQ